MLLCFKVLHKVNPIVKAKTQLQGILSNRSSPLNQNETFQSFGRKTRKSLPSGTHCHPQNNAHSNKGAGYKQIVRSTAIMLKENGEAIYMFTLKVAYYSFSEN